MADTELIDETAASSVASTDLMYIVKDPAGTPLDRKATAAQFATFMSTAMTNVTLTSVTSVDATARVIWNTGYANYGIKQDGNGGITILNNNTDRINFGTHVRMTSIGYIGWGSGVSSSDVNISRAASGVAQVGNNNTTLNNDGRLELAWMKWDGMARTTSQFDKTNTTLADITDLSITLASGKTYKFTANLFVTADATGGLKVAMSGTATITSARYDIVAVNKGTSAIVISSEKTALDSSSGHAGATTATVTVEGVITVNAGGTLTVQFAQNAANGTSSVLVGSSLLAHEF
jgi:hypothetical protein